MSFENFTENKPKENNYYDILGVSRNASPEEIRSAFRNLVKKTHPDAVGNDSKQEDFYQINEAYETLIDENKRNSYDSKFFNSSKAKQDSQRESSSEKNQS